MSLPAPARSTSPPRSMVVGPRRAVTAPTVSVVIPAKNEARNLPWVLPRIPMSVDEVILVDGLSTDETVAVAKMTLPDVVVVHEPRPGKGVAVRTGFKKARGDIIVMLDADGSMDPLEIPRFVDAILSGADFVKGSRFMSGGGTTDMTFIRKMGNAGLRELANVLYRTAFSDLCYGYCAMRRTALEGISLDADGFDIEMQLIARMHLSGVSSAEVASFEHPRRHGASNLRALPDGWRVLKALLRERFRTSPLSDDSPAAGGAAEPAS